MDHCEKKTRKTNPRERTNFCSLLTFTYTGSLFVKAYKKDLEEEDLYEVVPNCNSKKCGDDIEMQWKLLKQETKKPTLTSLVWNLFGYSYLILGTINLIWRIIYSVVEPHALSKLISYFNEGQTIVSKNDAFYYASLVIALDIINCFYVNNYTIVFQQLAIRTRTAFSSLIYRKSLKLSSAALSDISLGNIVTLVTKDMHILENSARLLNETWVGVLQTFVVTYLLYAKMGPVALIGIGVIVSVLPLQIYLGKMVTNFRLRICQKSDERLQMTQEVLSAIRIIKMYTWETYYYNRVNKARRTEVNTMLKSFCIRVVIILVGILCSKIGFYLLIMSYIWLGFQSNAELVFYALSCFKDLSHSLCVVIPLGMTAFADLYAACIRINTILKAEELHPSTSTPTANPKIELSNVSVNIKQKEILKNVSLNISSGLTLITGNVGSGKSALIRTFLQDLEKSNGNLNISGRISYASQDPWIFPSSIRQNIIFGQPFNQTRYDEVLRVCALKYDLDLLDNEDETIISDKGINLSKGQQARVNLARAVYKESEIYLLDDSLAALDAHVQDHIFNKCIKQFLNQKIVVLVTQNVSHLNNCDRVIVMDQGSVKSLGAPDDVRNELEKVLKDNVDKEEEEENMEKIPLDEKEIKAEHIIKKNIYREKKQEGVVSFAVYKKYLKYGGGFLMFGLCILLFTVTQTADSYSTKLLTKWVDLNQKTIDMESGSLNSTNSTYSEAVEDRDFTIKFYSGMLVAGVLLSFVNYFTLLNFCRTASINLHKAMTFNIINAVMSFFDNNFIGNILNRFSQDFNNVDEHLPFVLAHCFRVSFGVLGALFLIASVNWIFLIPATFFVITLVALRTGYMPAGRSLKRLEASTRSPLIGHLNASLEGLTTIRAFHAQEILKDEFDKHQDLFTTAHYTLACATSAFGFFISSICTVFLALVVARFLFFEIDTSAGKVGLAITQSIMLATSVQWGIRQWADLENQMTSTERALEYTDIKQEYKSGNTPKDWPSKGVIQYKNVTLTYNNTTEQVLKCINFEIAPKQKIGIVGRTGAGKSSIISTLLRLYEIEGQILIDDIDAKTVSLTYLRQRISIIPQDPVLFTNTLRANIDPDNKYTDQEIWTALEKVKMKKHIPSLEFAVTEGGNAFSAGQKQLICLARAIIRKNKIVILDEATANMDPETDALLLSTIRDNFSSCTVITIAHRLHSVIDCDKVIVLDKGRIVQFDDPQVLVDQKEGLFFKMVEQSGLLNNLS